MTFNHCTSLPHIIFCIMLLYVFKYFILLLCIITFNIDYCHVLLHTPSHVWPEFTKLLSIVYCLLSISFLVSEDRSSFNFFEYETTGTTHQNCCQLGRPYLWLSLLDLIVFFRRDSATIRMNSLSLGLSFNLT